MKQLHRLTWQQPLSRRETASRSRAVSVAHKARGVGIAQRRVAGMIDRSPRTLRDWKQRERRGNSLAKPRGRRVVRSARAQRQALLASFCELGPSVGIAVYQALHSQMPRREVESMILRGREAWRRLKPKQTYRLAWSQPGRVWAVDHSHTPSATKQTRIAISCRDLASHQQLLWQRSRETAQVTTVQLRRSFVENGAPLVLKADGGPSFRSHDLQQLLDEYGVELLPSPPYYPEFNGSCEAANGSMKNRTHHVAESNGRAQAWDPWDLELARLQANHTTRPWGVNGPVPSERWMARGAIPPAERDQFRATCRRLRQAIIVEKELSPDQLVKEATARSVQRAAVSRALVEHGLLTVQRRVVRPPIQTIRSA